MFSQELSLSDHTRRFTVKVLPSGGWEVGVEEDGRLVRQAHFGDWHRLERALVALEREMLELQEIGWARRSRADAGLVDEPVA